MLVLRNLVLSFFIFSVCTASASRNVTFKCQNGWDLIGTHCYNFVNIKMDFEDAKDVCDKYGSKLLVVRDEVEARNVSSLATNKLTGDLFWIYNGKGTDGNNGSLNETFCSGMWQPNEPKETEEDAAVVSNKEGRWALKWIWTNLPFVCRAPACPVDSFRCSNGGCINKKWTCDSTFECLDHSDENDCKDCTKYYRNSSGTVDTSSLSDSDLCQWIIEGKPGEVLRIEFEKLIIEDYVDSIRVYSGGPSIMSSELIWEMRKSQSVKLTLFSKNHFLIITLHSDVTNFKPLIKANWVADNEASWKQVETFYVTNVPGSISSPHSSSFLDPVSFKKEWSLTAPVGELITLEVLDNTFEPNGGSDVYLVTNVGFVLKELNSNKAVYVSSKNSMSVIIKAKSGKRRFKARFFTGCNFSTKLSSASFKLVELPVNLMCSWAVENKLGTYLRLKIDKSHFDDSQDFFQVYKGADVNSAVVIDTLNHSNEGVREFDLHSEGISFIYYSDLSHPGSEVEGTILADCPEFPNTNNLSVTYGNTNANEKAYIAQITCDAGFAFKQEEYSGNSTLYAVCNEDGVWDWGSPSYTRFPECQVVYCGFPPSIPNGYVSDVIGNITYKGEATYSCYFGFKINGSSTVTCGDNGIWSDFPQCIADTCSAVPNVTHANYSVTDRNLPQGSVVEYFCDAGYDLIGSRKIVCKQSKTWSREPTTCRELTCPLPIIDNGHYKSGSVNKVPKFGEMVHLICDTGYQIDRTKTQNTSLRCSKNRTLSTSNDLCVDVDECSNGANNCTKNQDCINTNGSFSCVCKSGFNGINCVDIDECASDVCLQICTNLQGSYYCTCHEGYTLYTRNGTNGFYIPLGEDGLKPGDVFQINHTCVPNLCEHGPEIPANGSALAVKSSYLCNETVEIICDFGFKLQGSSFATCESDGNWTYTRTPFCTKLTCSQPAVGMREALREPATGDIGPGASLTIVCNLDGTSGKTVNKTLICAPSPDNYETFILQGDNPKCPEVDCGSPWRIPGAQHNNATGTTYGSTFEFGCDRSRGFQVMGTSALLNNTVICQSNGRWGYGNLTCEGLRCHDPGTMAGTFQNVTTSYEIDQIVRYSCIKPGFTPVPNDTLVCEFKNGVAQWSGTPPTCEDTMKPVLSCPSGESFDLYSSLVYSSPNVTDNSGFAYFTIESGPPSGVLVMSKNITVKFKATDSKNDALCEVNFSVKDVTDPVVVCPSVVHRDLGGSKTEIFYVNETLLTSHSGDGIIIFDPVGPITLTIGSVFPIRAKITKDNGLKKECAFLIMATSTTCTNDTLSPPDNGIIHDCTGDGSSMTCSGVCNVGYLFQNEANSTTYSCTDGTWDTQLPLKPCLKLPGAIFDFDMTLQYKYNGVKYLFPAQYDADKCLQSHYTLLAKLVENMTACGYDSFKAKDIKRQREINLSTDEITFILQLLTSDGNLTALNNCAVEILSQAETLFGPTNPGSSNLTCLPPWKVLQAGSDVKLKGFSCDFDAKLLTNNGNSYCLPCGPGMYFNSSNLKCEECQDGYYQDEIGKTTCKQCPIGVQKSRLPRTRDHHCYELCPAGFRSTSGYVQDNCMLCPENHFSINFTTCHPCPNNGSTSGVSGAKSESECSDPCPQGQYSLTGYMPCFSCPRHFYTDTIGARSCQECPDDRYTIGNGSNSSGECLTGNNLCSNNFCDSTGTALNKSCTIYNHRPVCTCKPGYYGDSCNQAYDICNPNPCYNNGICTVHDGFNFTCTCPVDNTCRFYKNQLLLYTSNTNIARLYMLGSDQCKDQCLKDTSCKAYLVEAGMFCFIYNHVVLDTFSNTHESYEKNCTAVALFDGPLCEKDLVNDCNDTVCTSQDFCMDLIGAIQCHCPQNGNYDSKCAKADDPCSGNNCNQHGTCVAYGSVRGVCECNPGYTGDKCEIEINECDLNSNGCLYNGTCQDGINTYKCLCVNGVTGAHCEIPADFCLQNDCQEADGGICTNDFQNLTAKCTCGRHYAKGSIPDACVPIKYCESSPCVNGSCVDILNGFRCDCITGFEGSLCQHNIDDCAGNLCLNGATCVDKIHDHFCQCPDGFTGAHCENNIDDCLNNCDPQNLEHCTDLISDYYCLCKPGFTGKNCSENVDECTLQEPCLHGGNCTDIYGGYNCTCPVGWTGRNCEQEIDYCHSSPCQNGGICHNLMDQPYCQCQNGTAGDKCEQVEDLCNTFSDLICTKNGKCKQKGGTPECQCFGDKNCTLQENLTLQFTTNKSLVSISAHDEGECYQLCLQSDSCVAFLVDTNSNPSMCLQYISLLFQNKYNGHKSYVKSCSTVQPYYSGKACELEKNQCEGNPCNGGICILSNMTFVCDCSNLKNVGGERCNESKLMYETCPPNIQRHEYRDKDGYLHSVCMCRANETVVGSQCKTVDRNYDLAFLEDFAEKGRFVTSEKGFYLDKNSDLTIALWVAAARQLDMNTFVLALRSAESGNHFLTVFNTNVQIRSDQNNIQNIPLDPLDDSYSWHFISVAWSMKEIVIVYDFQISSVRTSIVRPSDEFVFIDLGYSFYGYISQVSVWKTVLSYVESFEIYNDKLAVPQTDSLQLGWTPYSYNPLVQKIVNSTAAAGQVSICNIPNTIAKKGLNSPDCKNKVFTDKTPPKFNFCNESAVVPTDYSIHQISSSTLGYEYTDEPGGTPKLPEKQFFSYGAYDIAVSAEDNEGNIGVCMTRTYITPNKCSGTEPSQNASEKCSNNPSGRKVTCPAGMMPSVPTPNYVSCGKLQTYNLDDMYEMPDRIICGVTQPRSLSVTMVLLYDIYVTCKDDVLSTLSITVMKNLNTTWPDLCSNPNCDNVNVTGNCNGTSSVDIHIEINGLPESLNSSSFNPLELMKRTITNNTLFDTYSVAGATLSEISQDYETQTCERGYGLSGTYCVQCGPGSFYHEGEMKCKLCALNKYGDKSGQNNCSDCPVNQVTFQKGSSSIKDCRINCSTGHMLNITTDGCVPCPKNFYQDKEGKSYCFPCPPSTGTVENGSTSLADCEDFCKPGTELIGHDCVECRRGFYNVGNTQDPCTQCPLNYTTRHNGSIAANECIIPKCPAGEFVQGNVSLKCEPCDYGTYQPNEDEFQCLPCTVNYTTENKGATNASMCQLACEPGFGVFQGKCEPCKRGMWNSGNNTLKFLKCQLCPVNFTTDALEKATNIDNCTIPVCPQGTYKNSTGHCLSCPVGQFQNETDQTSCKNCGTVLGYEASTFFEGSENETDCFPLCSQGVYLNINSRSCVLCPVGSYKDTKNLDTACQTCSNGLTNSYEGETTSASCKLRLCGKGYYREPNSINCTLCPIGEYKNSSNSTSATACTPCPFNTTTLLEGAPEESYCIKNCSEGEENNYISQTSDTCTACPPGMYRPGGLRQPPTCLICPYGFTTQGPGASNCTVPTPTAYQSNVKLNVSVDVTFQVLDCSSDPTALTNAIQGIILQLLQNQNNRYQGLCPSNNCMSDIDFKVKDSCDPNHRRKRQANTASVSASGTANANVTMKNVDAVVTRKSDSKQRSSLAALQEAFYDLDPLQGNFTKYNLTFVSVKPLSCGSSCALSRNFYPHPCVPGQFKGTSDCEPCPKGSYSTKPVSDSCRQCPNGLTTAGNGSTDESLCDNECAASPNFCGSKGSCKRAASGKHYCECTTDYTGSTCNQRRIHGDNTDKIVGITVGVGGFLIILLVIFGICAYRRRKNRNKEKVRKASNRSLVSESEYDDRRHAHFTPTIAWADPTMYQADSFELQNSDPSVYTKPKKQVTSLPRLERRGHGLYRTSSNDWD